MDSIGSDLLIPMHCSKCRTSNHSLHILYCVNQRDVIFTTQPKDYN